MADLGAIGILVDDPKTLHTHRILGVVTGTDGNPVRQLIRAYDRGTALLSGATYSNEISGNYAIGINILYGNREVTVVAHDPGFDSNARVIDRVIPVPL